MKLNNGILFASALALAACGSEGGNEASKTEKKEIKLAEEVCNYSYNAESVTASWTAFKFTEKAGVGGKFDSVIVSTSGSVDSPEKMLGELKFEIPISSTNTNNPDRDMKIIEYFFGTLSNTEMISGNIVSAKGNNEEGTAMVNLSMNDKTFQQEVNYKIEGAQVSLMGTIDVGNWNGNDAIAALNKVCDDLHKGEDGISKLWPTVDISIVALLDKSCN
ncbi:YceI family protein [Salibacteraceae bacterium]|jgi:polyisoprenoid-binding protein YceI|nr:YceI family protein [Bacteroidota bacterium]MDB9725033.1 YceI family protein [Salibacteraceae bacterium]